MLTVVFTMPIISRPTFVVEAVGSSLARRRLQVVLSDPSRGHQAIAQLWLYGPALNLQMFANWAKQEPIYCADAQWMARFEDLITGLDIDLVRYDEPLGPWRWN